MPLISIIIRNKSIWRFENVKNLYWFITSLLYYLLLSLIPCKRKQNQFKSWKSLSSEYREIVRCGHTPKWLKTISRGENDQNYHEIGRDFRKKLRPWIDGFCKISGPKWLCFTFLGHLSVTLVLKWSIVSGKITDLKDFYGMNSTTLKSSVKMDYKTYSRFSSIEH